MNKKVSIFTTIFPMKEEYIIAFFDSLISQTYSNFDIIVVNDGFLNFSRIKDIYKRLNIIELPYSNTIGKNREYGINYCIEKEYDILIFGDMDDYFEKNRVEKSLEFLKGADIVVNDLNLFDKNGIFKYKYISNRLENKSEISIDFIKDKNIFGLSNSAISLKFFDNITIPDNLIAVDWYIFTLFLLEGKKAIFTNETVTYYRQYEDNIVGLKELDLASLKKGIEVKIKHFENLVNKTNIFSQELERVLNIELKIKNKKIKNPLWWELI